MNKKIVFTAASAAFLLVVLLANAQMPVPAANNAEASGVGTVASSATATVVPGAMNPTFIINPVSPTLGGSNSSGTPVMNPPIIARPILPPTQGNNIIQFNNLTVQSVSATTPPAEIVANGGIYNIQSGGTTPPTMQPMNAQVFPQATQTSSMNYLQSKCLRYESLESNSPMVIACPVPQTSAPASSTVTVSPGATAIMPVVPPIYRGGQYRLEVSTTTHLMFNDRTSAALTDFSPGDQINVYGIYNEDGTVDALIVRNLSKPFTKQFVQLNNVNLVSVSATTTPATLVVAQQIANPCYGFGTDGNTRQGAIACPTGLQSLSDNAASQNVTVPQAIMPIFNQSRKYVIQIDTQTILMDRERGTLALGDLKIGDQLNIYGATLDTNGATINADIVRDLTQPPVAQNYSGRVTQVNADGSFVIQN